VLSPLLFNYFINELIEQIISEEGGSCLGNVKTSILAYCDDLIILSPSLKKIEKFVGICVDYSLKWIFKFNADTSLIMNCGFKLYENSQIKISLGDKILETKDTCKYLGLILNENNDGNRMAIERFNQVRRSFFSLNSFGMKPVGVNTFIKSFLYNTYCLPKLTHGMGMGINYGYKIDSTVVSTTKTTVVSKTKTTVARTTQTTVVTTTRTTVVTTTQTTVVSTTRSPFTIFNNQNVRGNYSLYYTQLSNSPYVATQAK
jgi:hypothetical protein